MTLIMMYAAFSRPSTYEMISKLERLQYRSNTCQNMTKHLVKGNYIPELGNKIVLYSNGVCAYAHRAHLVLHAKKIPYQAVYIDVDRQPEWFTQKCPLGRVPVLELPDKTSPIIDSLIVVEYLDDKYPEIKLYPKDAYQRAKEKVLIFRFNAVLETVEKIMNRSRIHNNCIENLDEIANELFNGLDMFEKVLQKRRTPFFGGITPGMVDYAIWPWFERMLFFPKLDPVLELDVKRFEKIIEWCKQMTEDPVVKSCALTSEFYYELYERIREKTLTTEFIDTALEKRESFKRTFEREISAENEKKLEKKNSIKRILKKSISNKI